MQRQRLAGPPKADPATKPRVTPIEMAIWFSAPILPRAVAGATSAMKTGTMQECLQQFNSIGPDTVKLLTPI